MLPCGKHFQGTSGCPGVFSGLQSVFQCSDKIQMSSPFPLKGKSAGSFFIFKSGPDYSGYLKAYFINYLFLVKATRLVDGVEQVLPR